MTQKPEPDSPESGPDPTRGGSSKAQPVLMGILLAAIVAMIMIAAFWVH